MIQTTTATKTALENITESKPIIDANVVLLNNFMGPHHWKQMRACCESVKKLSILLSTEMEPNRHWVPDWGNLDVHVQKSLL